MKKSILLMIVAFFTGIFCLNAQELPIVAVLEAHTGDGVDRNASAIVVEAIIQQFVESTDYAVTDRTYIADIQDEKKFQLSGEVSEDDIKALGATFGADYLCVSTISCLASTYTVSARLIEVETAEVIDQALRRKRGDVSVLYDLSDFVGSLLAGTDLARQQLILEKEKEEQAAQEEARLLEEQRLAEEKKKAEDEERRKAQEEADRIAAKEAEERAKQAEKERKKAARKAAAPRSHLTCTWMYPGLTLYDTDITGEGNDSLLYEQDQYYSGSLGYDSAVDSLTLDFSWLKTFLRYAYISFNGTYMEHKLTIEDEEYDNFILFEPYGGIGLILGNRTIDIYGGVTMGYMCYRQGNSYLWNDPEEWAYGVSYGYEAGIDLNLGGIGITAKYRYTLSTELAGELIFTDEPGRFGYQGFLVGGGFYF